MTAQRQNDATCPVCGREMSTWWTTTTLKRCMDCSKAFWQQADEYVIDLWQDGESALQIATLVRERTGVVITSHDVSRHIANLRKRGMKLERRAEAAL